MYELVNTSLPNGLIAGTHGFATVAMTKGVSDLLRSRLETFCAYTHRTSVHDASYYEQNPINWFHVTLPQGDHVVGRVAPSDFDYTGRTNRLARIRVFSTSEMPGVGGAEILAHDKHWFSQSWQGEPRYLDEDKSICGHLQMLGPVETSRAPAWEALFGGGGLRYAQQVAWQVEKNLASGGKTIYFKASTTWDVSGEKLLGLFADVINLLPLEIRPRVTFSTYAASLPGGTRCCLRGIYDRDKFFDAAAVMQTWIDCENAKVVHAEMLPTSDPVRKVESKVVPGKQTTSVGLTGHFRSGDASASSLRANHSLVSAAARNSYSNRWGWFWAWLAVFVFVVILGFCGFAYKWMQDNKKEMQDSGAAVAVEAEKIKSLEDEKEQQERIAKEKRNAERKEALERDAKESAEKEAAARKAKAEQEAEAAKRNHEKEKAAEEAEKKKMAAEKVRRESEEREKQKTAFVGAHVEGRGTPPKPKTGLASTIKALEEFKVFYYSDGGVTLTNEVAGYKPINDPINRKKITDYKLYIREPNCGLAPLGKSPVVLWMCQGKVWFDWKLQEAKRRQWFKDQESHDLQMECFGLSEEVFAVWNETYPVTYVITWGDEEGQSEKWPSREFKLKDAVDVVCKKELERKKKFMKDSEKGVANKENEIENLKQEIDGLDKSIAEYADATNKLEKIKAELTKLKEQQEKRRGKKLDEKAKERFENLERELKKQKSEQEAVVQKKNIKSGEDQVRARSFKLKRLEDELESLKQKLEKMKSAYEIALKDPDREKKVRAIFFGVAIVERGN